MAPKVSDAYKEEKKKELLRIASSVFGEKGYFEARMDDIVTASGMSKGAIYNYFKSKEEVYEEMLALQVEEFLSALRARLNEYELAHDKMAALFNMYKSVDWLDEKKMNEGRNQFEYWINGGRNENPVQLLAHHQKFTSFIREIIQQGQSEGDFDRSLPLEAAANWFWMFVDGFFLHGSVLKSHFPTEDIVNMTRDMYIHILVKGEMK